MLRITKKDTNSGCAIYKDFNYSNMILTFEQLLKLILTLFCVPVMWIFNLTV